MMSFVASQLLLLWMCQLVKQLLFITFVVILSNLSRYLIETMYEHKVFFIKITKCIMLCKRLVNLVVFLSQIPALLGQNIHCLPHLLHPLRIRKIQSELVCCLFCKLSVIQKFSVVVEVFELVSPVQWTPQITGAAVLC